MLLAAAGIQDIKGGLQPPFFYARDTQTNPEPGESNQGHLFKRLYLKKGLFNSYLNATGILLQQNVSAQYFTRQK